MEAGILLVIILQVHLFASGLLIDLRYVLGVSALPDTEHFVKTGPWDLLRWEHMVYGVVQEGSYIPKVCESFVDLDGAGYLVLHRVFCLHDMFKLLGRIFHNLCSNPTLMLFCFS